MRSSLEEEFKKHLLQHFNGDPSSSSQAERLKVRASGRAGAARCARYRASTCAVPWPLAPPACCPHVPQHGSNLQRMGGTLKLPTSPAPDTALQDLSAAASSSSSSSSSTPGSATPGSSSLPQDPCGEAAGGPASLGLGGEPYHPLEFYPTSHIDLDWGAGRLALPGGGATPASDRARCFVILFGVGRAETEGIYSLRALAKEDGLPVDTIVAFEAEDDAQR